MLDRKAHPAEPARRARPEHPASPTTPSPARSGVCRAPAEARGTASRCSSGDGQQSCVLGDRGWTSEARATQHSLVPEHRASL